MFILLLTVALLIAGRLFKNLPETFLVVAVAPAVSLLE
jgi:hypothetical protein